MSALARDSEGHRIQATRAALLQPPVTVGAVNAQSAVVDGGSTMAIIGATVDCYIAQGENPNAETTPTGFLFAGAMVYKRVIPGKDKFAAVSMDGSAGKFFVEEDTEQ